MDAKQKKQLNKILLIFGGVLLLALIAWVIYYFMQTRPQKLKELSTGNAPSFGGAVGSSATGNSYNDPIDPNRILKKGDAGNNVKILQTEVNNVIIAKGSSIVKLVPDGVFGSATETAIQQLSEGMLSSAKGNISINAVKAIPSATMRIVSYSSQCSGTKQPCNPGTYWIDDCCRTKVYTSSK